MERGFLFDLDGTLVDSERDNGEAIAEVLAACGRLLTNEEREFVVGHGWREIHKRLLDGGPLELSFDELIAATIACKERICDARGLRVLPGAVDFVRRAAERGRCAVVSGSSRSEIAWCLRRLELEPEIPWFVGAEDVAQGKPSPEGYLAAARYLGVAPSRCTVFEDSHAGITAARRAGMHCVALAVGNFLGQDQSSADVRVETFLDLGERLWEGGA